MIKYLLVFLLLKSFLFGCSLCSIYSPKTHVDTQIKADKESIKSLRVNWIFANEFTKELLQIYDTNLDRTFNEKELALIQDSLIDYLKQKNFLTTVSYDKQININDVSYTIDAPTLSVQEDKKKEEIITKPQEKVEEKTENKDSNVSDNSSVQNQNVLEIFTLNIKKYLIEIQQGENKFALFFLLMASFLYGVVHAFGPGHGKALAFSYFSSQKSSYFQALVISLATAFIHIVGAFVLVLISVFILQSVMNRFMEDSISYITSFSALIIMFLALYILYRKVTKKSSTCACCSVELKKTTFMTTPNHNINFVKTTLNKPVITQSRSKKQDLIFVLTAGIIPCPGTVLLFVYAFLLKTYFAVILASISISLGMATVIFVSSFLGVSLNKASSKSKKLINILEIVSPIFMFFLGLLLFLNINKF